MEDTCDVDSICNGYGLLHICSLSLELNQDLYVFCLCTLFSFNNIKLHSLSISYTAMALPGVNLYGSLVHKYIFLGVIPVDETIYVCYIEPSF